MSYLGNLLNVIYLILSTLSTSIKDCQVTLTCTLYTTQRRRYSSIAFKDLGSSFGTRFEPTTFRLTLQGAKELTISYKYLVVMFMV